MEEDQLIDTPWIPQQAPPEYDTRGVSGAPLISLVNEEGVWSWRLAGVICEAPEAGGMILATRADYVMPDGKLKRFD